MTTERQKIKDKSVIAGFILAINTINALRNPDSKGYKGLMQKVDGVGLDEVVSTLTAMLLKFATESSVSVEEMEEALNNQAVKDALKHDGTKH